mmetsp:Transcript_19442/g.66091  ORF Transcript_19442/g.66091 Transcript_19442/m.66091 type:complete len:293 (-) Transcript_19442:3717-4595(-)
MWRRRWRRRCRSVAAAVRARGRAPRRVRRRTRPAGVHPCAAGWGAGPRSAAWVRPGGFGAGRGRLAAVLRIRSRLAHGGGAHASARAAAPVLRDWWAGDCRASSAGPAQPGGAEPGGLRTRRGYGCKQLARATRGGTSQHHRALCHARPREGQAAGRDGAAPSGRGAPQEHRVRGRAGRQCAPPALYGALRRAECGGALRAASDSTRAPAAAVQQRNLRPPRRHRPRRTLSASATQARATPWPPAAQKDEEGAGSISAEGGGEARVQGQGASGCRRIGRGRRRCAGSSSRSP